MSAPRNLDRTAAVPVLWADSLDRRISLLQERIADEANSLTDRLSRLADEMGHEVPSFNSLGEIQQAGPGLDRMLGELAVMRELRRTFHSVSYLLGEKEDETRLLNAALVVALDAKIRAFLQAHDPKALAQIEAAIAAFHAAAEKKETL